MQRGGIARLTWNLKPLAGQTVTFAEEGKGAPPRVLKTTSAAKGSLTYKPYLMPMRSREVVATVEQDGKPRKRFVVARYTAPPLGVMTAGAQFDGDPVHEGRHDRDLDRAVRG